MVNFFCQNCPLCLVVCLFPANIKELLLKAGSQCEMNNHRHCFKCDKSFSCSYWEQPCKTCFALIVNIRLCSPISFPMQHEVSSHIRTSENKCAMKKGIIFHREPSDINKVSFLHNPLIMKHGESI